MSSAILVIGLVSIFIGIAVVVMVFSQIRERRGQLSRSMAMVENAGPGFLSGVGPTIETSGPRTTYPVGKRLRDLGHRFTRAGWDEKIQTKLDRAGKSATWDIQRVLATKVGLALVFAIGWLFFGLLVGFSVWIIIVGAVALGALGFYAPDIWLSNTASKRSEEIERALPDTMDLLMISVESGLAFDAAVDHVAEHTRDPMAGELRRTLQEMQIGKSRAEALRSLAERVNSPDLDQFVSAVAQADSLGIPIVQVLRSQTREMRMKRSQRTEERAAKLPVKIIFPTILFILPALFLVVMGPAAIRISQMFSGL